MVRHAEIKEQEIIDAGIAIKNLDKRANSESTGVKLSNRGDFIRIKEVWDNHIKNREPEDGTDIELPVEIQAP